MIEGDRNVILAGTNTTVKGEGNFVAGKNIKYNANQDTNGSFVWSDNLSSRRGVDQFFTPQQSNSFYIRAAGGVAIGKDSPDPKFAEGVDVAGMVQIADQNVSCSADTLGAMKFNAQSCFCACIKE